MTLRFRHVFKLRWAFDENTKCYRVRPGWQFPVMNLTQEEIVGQATATAIAGAAGLHVGTGAKPTTRKLAATLSGDRQQLQEDAEQLISVLDLKLADHSRSHEVIRTLQWALLDRNQLSSQYVSPYQDKAVKLTLHPYRLCFAQQAWYLVARPVDRDVPKTYQVTRFKTVRTLGTAADVPEDFDLKSFFGSAWGVFRGKETYDVELLFSKDAAPLVTETTWHATQKVKQHATGRRRSHSESTVSKKFCGGYARRRNSRHRANFSGRGAVAAGVAGGPERRPG